MIKREITTICKKLRKAAKNFRTAGFRDAEFYVAGADALSAENGALLYFKATVKESVVR